MPISDSNCLMMANGSLRCSGIRQFRAGRGVGAHDDGTRGDIGRPGNVYSTASNGLAQKRKTEKATRTSGGSPN
jgi:hypothetical protein